jgi:cysteine desulfurase/selenocysteine lyase
MSTSNANIHRWAYTRSEQSEQLYDNTKKLSAWLLWCHASEIRFGYNATNCLNIIIHALCTTYKYTNQDTIMLGIRDHHATIVTRQLLSKQYGFHIKYIYIDKTTHEIDRDDLRTKIQTHTVRAIFCSHVSNITGHIYPVEQIRTLVSDGIFVCIDGSQMIPHHDVDVTSIQCDAYIYTGHKIMAMTGIGVAYLRKSYIRSLETTRGGWSMIESVSQTSCTLVRTSGKFEPGTPNMAGIASLHAAIIYRQSCTLDTRNLLEYTRDALSRIPYIILLWTKKNNIGIVSFVIDGIQTHIIQDHLESHHICVRSGGHCAHPLLEYLGHIAGVVRVSLYGYNTVSDIDYFIQTLMQIPSISNV